MNSNTTIDAFLAGLGPAMDYLRLAAGLSAAELEARGVSPKTAADIERLCTMYFGQTTFTRRQRRAIAGALAHGHGLAELVLIEDEVAKVAAKLGQAKRWELREKLCRTPSSEIESASRTIRRPWRTKPKPPDDKITIRRHANGKATVSLTGPDAQVTEFAACLNPEDPAGSLREVLDGNAAIPRILYLPLITFRVEDYCELLGRLKAAGDNPTDADIVVRASNGVRLTGADLAERLITDRGLIAAVSREHGPVDLYRFQRFASAKQRAMLAAESPECSWLGCTVPFDKCQIHHLHAWADGGDTNVSNMTPLCPHHNGANEDNPPGGIPQHRGRMDRLGGQIAWLPPGGGDPVFTSPTT
ncbi:HNH endonuclease [Corynebacterium lizhenjunii]|uniref:HNH endonuclease n=1 Tax=Corynebacterium lizhenjunii TaxID=2709394 RepID=A0A7T0KER8_9CORY|nr:HNH endonuclease signature motif containing protein [Corynebacterium lizhenjunii]QPK78971.1 HNH endonuclease [Corynebacterium lizhenjunii]